MTTGTTLRTTTVRTLTLESGSGEGRHPHLSAASGLVRRGDFLYVLADDEVSIGVFRAGTDAPGRLVPVLEGELPAEDEHTRKAAKPDLEALTALPPFEDHPHGALLGLGSGSKPTRERGFVHPLGPDGGLRGEPRTVDLSGLHAELRPRVPGLNIEGVAVSGDRLVLLQRGNSAEGVNLVIELALPGVTAALRGDPAIGAEELLRVSRFDLGEVDGVPLAFTDGDALPDGRLVITAATEATDDPYHDAEAGHSAVGVVTTEGEIHALHPLDDPTLKVEGVDAVLSDELVHVLLCCDADDPAVPSPLLSGTFRA